jgi:hypothetical protein
MYYVHLVGGGMERRPVRELGHPSHLRWLHTKSRARVGKRPHTSMAKCSPSRLCSEPLSSSWDQCRCNCVARYFAARPPPAILTSFPSDTITKGHRRGRVLVPVSPWPAQPLS